MHAKPAGQVQCTSQIGTREYESPTWSLIASSKRLNARAALSSIDFALLTKAGAGWGGGQSQACVEMSHSDIAAVWCRKHRRLHACAM